MCVCGGGVLIQWNGTVEWNSGMEQWNDVMGSLNKL